MKENEYKIISACFELAGKNWKKFEYDKAIPFLKIGLNILAQYLTLEKSLQFSNNLKELKSGLESVYLRNQAKEIKEISKDLTQKVLNNYNLVKRRDNKK